MNKRFPIGFIFGIIFVDFKRGKNKLINGK
jgi:hypothetical protein